jgi:hypothetical protein
MSTPNPVLAAAAPSLITILQAVQSLVANVGSDPAQIAIKFGPAVAMLLATIEMQLPGLASSEIGVLESQTNAKIGGWISQLKTL